VQHEKQIGIDEFRHTSPRNHYDKLAYHIFRGDCQR
jgi:hypothetical protein